MVIIEWTKPGVWLEGFGREDGWRLEGQIGRLEDALIEANVILNMFDRAAESSRTTENIHAEFEVRRQILKDVEAELFPGGMMCGRISEENFHNTYNDRKILVDTEVRRRLWVRGFLPRSFLDKPQFIFAKSFIHALDLFDKFLDDIAKDPSSPQSMKGIHEKFRISFPDLREVRNSLQHAEDRSKGEHRGKKIDLKEIDMSKVSIKGTALVGTALDGNRFGATMANGEYGAIDVSAQTVCILKDTLLEVYSVFSWRGGESLYPK
ncbi:hypothetical protein KO516_14925 [Citreicella sp. C3M06]|uniref:hypothetical protein n=1 Tax=Citreicella sp. C3M06 TaxID=2841564 RepID=UPI001C0984FA|nr:hypothetical protein [Citreicella sp. C3M06]MBU2962080.1 hypothetical protein [Citreicella sp. C3M06]